MSIVSKLSLAAPFLGLAFIAATNNPYWQDPKGVRETLERVDITPTKIGGYGWFNCYGLDRTKFEGHTGTGKSVSGTVCKPLWGENTIALNR